MDTAERQAIRAVLGGDPDAYRMLMERYYASVVRMAFRITGDETDAEEAAQEAFLRAYRKLATFQQTSSFGTWVTRIAINAALTLAERRRREGVYQGITREGEPREDLMDTIVDANAGPERLLLNREVAGLRKQAMETLTPMERTAFTMRHMEEMPIAEIAAALQVPANSAKQAVFRAVSKLRSALSPVMGGVR